MLTLLKVIHERSKQKNINLPKNRPMITNVSKPKFYRVSQKLLAVYAISIIVRYCNCCVNVTPKCFQYDDQFRLSRHAELSKWLSTITLCALVTCFQASVCLHL